MFVDKLLLNKTQKIMNHKFQNLILAIVIFLGFFALAGGAEAATLEVGTGKTYSTIQAAVNAAQPGDTVLVYAGTYTDKVLMSASGGTYLPEDASKYANVVLKNNGMIGNWFSHNSEYKLFLTPRLFHLSKVYPEKWVL